MSEKIYHITTHEAIDKATISGVYCPEGFDVDGFIHYSYAGQVAGVIDRFFKGVDGLVLLEIDIEKLDGPIEDENLEGGEELFPHVYSLLPMEAVYKIYVLSKEENLGTKLPNELK